MTLATPVDLVAGQTYGFRFGFAAPAGSAKRLGDETGGIWYDSSAGTGNVGDARGFILYAGLLRRRRQ